MSDARWFEVEQDVAAASMHFANAAALFERDGFAGDDLAAYQAKMAFMHAMQAGHTSMESAFVRILRMFGEEVPTGTDWHSDLIRRVSCAVAGRPVIIAGTLAESADETRRFRNVAMRSYDQFVPRRAIESARAARFIADHLADAIGRFRASLDP